MNIDQLIAQPGSTHPPHTTGVTKAHTRPFEEN